MAFEGAADTRLVEGVRRELRSSAYPEKAPVMQAYMKSEMPFYGVQRPAVQRICRRVFTERRLPDRDSWEATVRLLWDGAERREERYCAIKLTGHRFYRDLQDPSTVPLYDHMVTTGAWWDFTDEIATRRVGPLVRAYPGSMVPVLIAWARDQDMWRRRTAILAQLRSAEQTDVRLLRAVIEPNLPDPQFFIRKSIGWALRHYARTDPDWVRAYVEEHADAMSSLSRREASKYL
ncbi:MAG: DNA alkylation repair protein [Propionibacteriales bacterium]|nr:DNA alkylation repair protein [Propionibacteriales bacterium]